MGLAPADLKIAAFPNPSNNGTTIRYSVDVTSNVKIAVYDMKGNLVNVLSDKKQEAGTYSIQLATRTMANGTYIIHALKDGTVKHSVPHPTQNRSLQSGTTAALSCPY